MRFSCFMFLSLVEFCCYWALVPFHWWKVVSSLVRKQENLQQYFFIVVDRLSHLWTIFWFEVGQNRGAAKYCFHSQGFCSYLKNSHGMLIFLVFFSQWFLLPAIKRTVCFRFKHIFLMFSLIQFFYVCSLRLLAFKVEKIFRREQGRSLLF